MLLTTARPVHVVKLYPRHETCGGVEELRGKAFRQRVVPLFFPTRHEVVAIFEDHAPQLGNLVGRVLKIGVHRDDHFAARRLETGVESSRLAVVARELYTAHDTRIDRSKMLHHTPRSVVGAVVDKYDFVRQLLRPTHPCDPCREFTQRLLFVEKGNDDRYVGSFTHFQWELPCCRQKYRVSS